MVIRTVQHILKMERVEEETTIFFQPKDDGARARLLSVLTSHLQRLVWRGDGYVIRKTIRGYDDEWEAKELLTKERLCYEPKVTFKTSIEASEKSDRFARLKKQLILSSAPDEVHMLDYVEYQKGTRLCRRKVYKRGDVIESFELEVEGKRISPERVKNLSAALGEGHLEIIFEPR